MKKAGVVLDDVHRWPNKKKGAWRRGSNASAISAAAANKPASNTHQPTPELGENDSSNNTEHERTVSPSPAVSAAIMDEASRSSAGGESDKAELGNEKDSSSPVLSLFNKTPYESFYDLRAMVWLGPIITIL